MVDQSFLTYFLQAGPVVKFVMLSLLGASIASWTLILQRSSVLRRARSAMEDFENRFWSGQELNRLYQSCERQPENVTGEEAIFHAGFKEFLRLRQQHAHMPREMLLEGVQRAMRVVHAREVDKLEQHLPFLATVGSTSPYVGLFGTVCGIMTVLQSLGTAQQATIAMVAPGMSEALVATAMGLFAAIPAVIAYNRFSASSDRLLNAYATFQEEFANILHRQASLSSASPSSTAPLV